MGQATVSHPHRLCHHNQQVPGPDSQESGCLAEGSSFQPWAAVRGQLKDRGPRWTQVCRQAAARPRARLHSQRSVPGSPPQAVKPEGKYTSMARHLYVVF